MIKNYLLIVLRNIRKHKTYSFINIAGLAVGLTSGLLILLFVRYERSYDRFNENTDQIYRVLRREPGNMAGGSDVYTNTPIPLKPALTSEFPDVVRAARVISQWRPTIKDRGGFRRENRFFLVDPEFLEMFTFPLAAGDPRTALSEPFTVLLTEDAARKYFGRDNPVGQALNIDGKYDFKITGILRNPPENSHIHFDFLASFQSWKAMNPDFLISWYAFFPQTYVQLAPRTSPARLDAKLPGFIKTKIIKMPYQKAATEFLLQPLADIHLRGRANLEIEANGDIRYVRFLEAVAALILLIACLNYMNLATARAAKRAKEIGVRKVVGAGRSHLVGQFLGESFVFAFLALAVSWILAQQLLPAFRVFIAREIPSSLLGQAGTLGIMAAVTILVGLFSGSYPAFFMSSLRPVQMLKGKYRYRMGQGADLRRWLVVSQFVVSIALAACTLIVSSQLRFIRTKDLGYVKDHIVTLEIEDGNLQRDPKPFRDGLGQVAGISDVAFSSALPGTEASWTLGYWEGMPDRRRGLIIYRSSVDDNFLSFYGMKLVQGRNFAKAMPSDAQSAYILNQSAVRAIGWSDPIGKNFYLEGGDKKGQVVGVVEDFHFQSLHEKIGPLAIQLDTEPQYVSIKIASDHVPETLAAIEKVFKKFSPAYLFGYRFLDERIDALYRTDQKLVQSFNSFTIIALFIAGLGLFGLAAFTAEQRLKEIGIRKVLGSSETGIVVLLNKEFGRWIAIAGLIAWPIAYFAMRTWMQSFAYRAPITIGVFLGAEAAALALAAVIVSLQAIKAARVNPVVILKQE
jgi:putative ABC transport system permease protein